MTVTVLVNGVAVELPDSALDQPLFDPQADLEGWRKIAVAQRPEFAIEARNAGHITQADAEAWIAGTALPAFAVTAMQAAFTDPDELWEQQMAALARIEIRRLHPLIDLFRIALSLTETEVDDLFLAAQLRAQNT